MSQQDSSRRIAALVRRMEEAEFAVATMRGTRWEQAMAAGRYAAALLRLHGALQNVQVQQVQSGYYGADAARINHMVAHVGSMTRAGVLRRLVMLGRLLTQHKTAQDAGSFIAMDAGSFIAMDAAFRSYIVMERRECARLAKILPDIQEPVDVILDRHTPGLRYRHLEAIEKAIAPICRRTFAQSRESAPDARFVMIDHKQMKLGNMLLDRMGFDRKRAALYWNAGAPFIRGYGDDVKIVARAQGRDFTRMVTDLLHEAAGHGVYRQSVTGAGEWHDTCAAMIPGAVADEVPALMMEHFIGRSKGFARFLHKTMNDAGVNDRGLTPEDIHAHMRQGANNMLRQDADLRAYPLHAMQRIRVVRALINGDNPPGNYPQLWWRSDDHYALPHELDQRKGMLGDVQMFTGYMGYFGSYLPALMGAAEAFERMEREVPDWEGRLGEGDFTPMMNWMRAEMYERGGTYRPITDPAAFVRHMTAHYAPPHPRRPSPRP